MTSKSMQQSRGNGVVMLAALSGAVAVALGAWGAHGLEKYIADMPDLTKRLADWNTAVRYQMVHTLAILGCGILMQLYSRKTALVTASLLFLAGILLFSGGLYGWVLTDVKTWVHVVPIGGLLLILGWVALCCAAWRNRSGRGDDANESSSHRSPA